MGVFNVWGINWKDGSPLSTCLIYQLVLYSVVNLSAMAGVTT